MAFACTVVLNVLELREGVRAVSEVTIPRSSVALVFVCFNVMSDMKGCEWDSFLCCVVPRFHTLLPATSESSSLPVPLPVT